ncbi:MAG: serine/threonine protein kinase, partial [Gammaproteobacteria bacterium]
MKSQPDRGLGKSRREECRGVATIFDELSDLDDIEKSLALKRLQVTTEVRMELEDLLRFESQARGFLSVSPAAAVAKPYKEETRWIGKQLGAYRRIRELGKGGMGAVYLGQRADGEFRKNVAVKLVNRSFGRQTLLSRFKVERQILADLEHPNIAGLLDGGTTENGYPYLVMEYVQGEPIDLYCRHKRLGLRDKLILFSHVCRAVQFAHDNRIVHCDLKPANILITRTGVPKLLDFGIAKLLEDRDDAYGIPTLPGFPMMTPEYASPEQVEGKSVGIASDIYSLGIVLYELLTGHRPSRTENTGGKQVIGRKKEVMPTLPSRFGTEIGGRLDGIVLRALATEPSDRFRSAGSFAQAVEQFLAEGPSVSLKALWRCGTETFIKHRKSALLAGGIQLLLMFAVPPADSIRPLQPERSEKEADILGYELTHVLLDSPGDAPIGLAALPVPANSNVLSEANAETNYEPTTSQQNVERREHASATQSNAVEMSVSNVGAKKDPEPKPAEYDRFAVPVGDRRTARDKHPFDAKRAVSLAKSLKVLSMAEGSKGRFGRAFKHAEHCLSIMEKYTDGRPRAVLMTVGCYTAAAHWLSALGNYRQANDYLASAQHTLESAVRRRRFRNQFKLKQGRIYEEMAEIAAQTGRSDEAAAFERKRLSIFSTLPENNQGLAQLANAEQALAARLSAVGDMQNAKKIYRKSLASWQRYSPIDAGDFSAVQGMAGIYAELSRLYAKSAVQTSDPTAAEKERQLSCENYRRSKQLVDTLPDPNVGFGIRYSWQR